MLKKMFLSFLLCVSFMFANSFQEIKDSGVIRIGVFTDQPPFSQFRDNAFEGFEVDFSKQISKDIFGENITVELVPTNTNQRIEFLQDNRVDLIIATLTITDDRLKMVDFSMPYFAVNLGVLTRKDDNIEKMSDLNGKTIIVESGSTGEVFFKQKGFKTTSCLNSNECYRMLRDGAGDAYANDNTIVLAYPVIDQRMEVSIKNLGNSDFLGIGVQKGNKELLDAVNEELINLSKQGFFTKSFQDTIDPFYKGTADKKYFLLDDIYSIFG